MAGYTVPWFEIVVVVVSLILFIIFVLNIVAFNRARTRSCAAISSGEATGLMWANIILAFLTAILFIWAIFRLVASVGAPVVPAVTTTATTVGPVMGTPVITQHTVVPSPLTTTTYRPAGGLTGFTD